jgi:hypothetical protein
MHTFTIVRPAPGQNSPCFCGIFLMQATAPADTPAEPAEVEVAPEQAPAPGPIQPPRPAPKVTSMAVSDLLTRRLLPSASRDARAPSLAAPRGKPPSLPRRPHHEQQPSKAPLQSPLPAHNAPSSSRPSAPLHPEAKQRPEEVPRPGGASTSRITATASGESGRPDASGGRGGRAGDVTREGGFLPASAGGSGRAMGASTPRGIVEEARPPDLRTQAQRDRDYNRAVLAAAEKRSVSAFDDLGLPAPQVCPARVWGWGAGGGGEHVFHCMFRNIGCPFGSQGLFFDILLEVSAVVR